MMQQYSSTISFGGGKHNHRNQSVKKHRTDDEIQIPPNFKILIIDDDLDFLKALAYTLSKKKIEFVTADSGETAIEMIKNTFFHLILLDLKMPTMNGAEIFKEIKRIKSRACVIVMTAYSDDDQVEIVAKLNPYGFLEKPFNVKEDLLPLIKKRIEEVEHEN
jgi:DNA-binding NtrC family response regulator